VGGSAELGRSCQRPRSRVAMLIRIRQPGRQGGWVQMIVVRAGVRPGPRLDGKPDDHKREPDDRLRPALIVGCRSYSVRSSDSGGGSGFGRGSLLTLSTISRTPNLGVFSGVRSADSGSSGSHVGPAPCPLRAGRVPRPWARPSRLEAAQPHGQRRTHRGPGC
jgi:hypothetical protein